MQTRKKKYCFWPILDLRTSFTEMSTTSGKLLLPFKIAWLASEDVGEEEDAGGGGGGGGRERRRRQRRDYRIGIHACWLLSYRGSWTYSKRNK